MRGKLLIFIVLFLITSLYFVIAAPSITPSTFSIDEDIEFLYNITVTNTDTGIDANITQVEISLPSGFTFTSNTNGSNTSGIFTSTTSNLTWTNSSILIGGEGVGYFWFNASASTPGNYNMTVKTTNITGSFLSNISITINDTTNPTSTLNSPSNNSINTNGTVTFDCSGSDNGELETIELYVWNSSNNIELTNTSSLSGTSDQSSWENTLADGTYLWNCFVNDIFGNSDWNTNRTLIINISTSTTTTTTTTNDTTEENDTETTECTPNWDCTLWDPEDDCPADETRTRTCTDKNNCGTNENKPNETRSCTKTGLSTAAIVSISIILLIVLGVGGFVLYLMKKKSLDEMTLPESPRRPPQNPGNQGSYQNPQSSPRFY